MTDYTPFENRKHMLRCALIDAIAWEESRVDAGCDSEPEDIAITQQKLKTYRKHLKKLDYNGRSLAEHIDDLVSSGEGQMLTIQEIFERKRP